jgi:hypothetical protein
MITILPSAEFTLDHRAYHLLAVTASGHILAVSQEGQCSFVAPDFSLLKSFHLSEAPTSVALAPAGDLMAVAIPGRMQVLDVLTQDVVTSFSGPFESAAFSPDGRVLWSVRRLTADLVSVEVCDYQTWRLVCQAELHDLFGESSFDLYFHPRGEYVGLWAAAGQDGQAIFFARVNGAGVEITRLANVDNTTPPIFHRDGNSFLILVDDPNELRHYDFPDCTLLGVVPCLEDESSGYYTQFVGDHHALMQWGEGRLYLVDLHTYSIVDEVAIRGHEPRPIPELYPTLKDDVGIGSDLCFFQPLHPGTFISVHQRLPKSSDDGEKYLLLAWDAPGIGA